MDKNGKSPRSSGLLASLPRIVKRALGRKDKLAVEPELPPLLRESGPSGLPPAPLRVRGPGAKRHAATRSRPDPDGTGVSGPSGLPAAPLRVEKRGL